MPTPPGITYWRKVTVVTPEGEREIWAPMTQPLASIEYNDGLSVMPDTDIKRLLTLLLREAERRAIALPSCADAPVDRSTAASLMQAAQTRLLEPGETVTIGPVP